MLKANSFSGEELVASLKFVRHNSFQPFRSTRCTRLASIALLQHQPSWTSTGDATKPKPARGQENDVQLILRKQCWLHKFSVRALCLTAQLDHGPLEEAVKRCVTSLDGNLSQIPALSLTVIIIPCYLPLVSETAAYEIHWFMCVSGLHKPLFCSSSSACCSLSTPNFHLHQEQQSSRLYST